MSETIILPLENALKEVYAAKRWVFPERRERRIVLWKTPKLLSSYSTQSYPVTAICGEILRLSRAVKIPKKEGERFDKRGSLDFYIALMNQHENQGITLLTTRNKIPDNLMSADVICGAIVFTKLSGIINKLKRRYNGKRNNEITPDLLRNMASDYLDFADYAFSIASPTEVD